MSCRRREANFRIDVLARNLFNASHRFSSESIDSSQSQSGEFLLEAKQSNSRESSNATRSELERINIALLDIR